jgi:HD superfamily phosphohydrolase
MPRKFPQHASGKGEIKLPKRKGVRLKSKQSMTRAKPKSVSTPPDSVSKNHKTWPKIIRDPVHNIIPFENTPCDRLLLDLINTKEFQRLRRIKQLGFSELVFPSANHSRFAHSIGVMHTARRLLDRVCKVTKDAIDEESQTLVLTAALIHDVGHGPFSHTFEKITGEDHEARTLEIIQNSSTEIHARLAKFDGELPKRLASFFDEDLEQPSANSPIPPFLTQIVSSQFDADRFDYLARDSYATGTDYGMFDLEWLIHHLYLEESGRNRFYLSHKGLYAAEDYVNARYHMYRSVYFHKTTRAAEVMLRLLLNRFKAELSAAGNKTAHKVVPNAPAAIIKAFQGKIQLQDYLLLDDHAISEFLKACQFAKDASLRSLADGLLNRRLYKATDVSLSEKTAVGKFTPAVLDCLRKLNRNPEIDFAEDTPGDTPYRPYDPDEEKQATQIYIETAPSRLTELSKHSESVDALKKKYTLVRYYYPPDIRNYIQQIAKETLRKD